MHKRKKTYKCIAARDTPVLCACMNFSDEDRGYSLGVTLKGFF